MIRTLVRSGWARSWAPRDSNCAPPRVLGDTLSSVSLSAGKSREAQRGLLAQRFAEPENLRSAEILRWGTGCATQRDTHLDTTGHPPRNAEHHGTPTFTRHAEHRTQRDTHLGRDTHRKRPARHPLNPNQDTHSTQTGHPPNPNQDTHLADCLRLIYKRRRSPHNKTRRSPRCHAKYA